jgi:hypothetical protein
MVGPFGVGAMIVTHFPTSAQQRNDIFSLRRFRAPAMVIAAKIRGLPAWKSS